MRRMLIPLLLLTLILAACTPSQTKANPPSWTLPTDPQPFDPAQGKPASVSTESSSPAVNAVNSSEDLLRSDSQGSVTFAVTPLNLSNPSDKLEFDISLNTHSVDLSMDLATLATLTTDTGITVQATSWDAPRGGHHVTGKLIFLASQDGKPFLEGADKLTLTIINVDAPVRVFEWELK